MKERTKKALFVVLFIISGIAMIIAILCSNSAFVPVITWSFNTLFAIGGVQLLHNKYKELQKNHEELQTRAVTGSYVQIKFFLQRLHSFINWETRWENSDILWRFLNEDVAAEHASIKTDKALLKEFATFSRNFWSFLTTTDNISPTNSITEWVNHQKKIIDLLLLGIQCEEDESVRRYDEAGMTKFFNEIATSANYITDKISDKITDYEKKLGHPPNPPTENN
jgi:hypothetical protein